MKVCEYCQENKEDHEFDKDVTVEYSSERRKKNPSGLHPTCKKCIEECRRILAYKDREQRILNAERIRNNNKNYRKNNKEKILKTQTLWRNKNKKRLNKLSRKRYYKNHDINKNKHREYIKKYRSMPKGVINHRMGNNIRQSLKGNKNGRHWEDLVGYTCSDLKVHLESLFIEGMTWEKFMNGEIHIDHIKPKSSFTFESPEDEEFKKCWALENLQPLWAKDNLSKWAKLDWTPNTELDF